MNEKNIYNLNHDPCLKLNPTQVDAYFSFDTDPTNPTSLYLDNSWGCAGVDLKPLIKAGETITTLFLTPKDSPTALQFNREDYGRDLAPGGGVDCIPGDDLSRIISMRLLKDVNPATNPIKDGEVYMFNGTVGLFEPFDLKTFYNNTNTTIAEHESRIDELEAGLAALTEDVKQMRIYFQRLIDALTKRVEALEAKTTPPSGVPASTPIAFGNINVYGDCSNTGSTANGIYTHSPSQRVANDLKFA